MPKESPGPAAGVRAEHAAHMLSWRAHEAPNPEEDRAGPMQDRANLARNDPAKVPWLPASSMRVHRGILDHHNSLWEDMMDLSSGSCGGMQMGLGRWLEIGRAARRALHLPRLPSLLSPAPTSSSPPRAAPSRPRARPFPHALPSLGVAGEGYASLGLNALLGDTRWPLLGASVAQLTAYRIAQKFGWLTPHLHVLGIGAVQWADPTLANALPPRLASARCTLPTRPASTPPPVGFVPTWWVPQPSSPPRPDSWSMQETRARLEARLARARRRLLRPSAARSLQPAAPSRLSAAARARRRLARARRWSLAPVGGSLSRRLARTRRRLARTRRRLSAPTARDQNAVHYLVFDP